MVRKKGKAKSSGADTPSGPTTVQGIVMAMSSSYANGWRFVTISNIDGKVVGTVPTDIQAGDYVVCEGIWINHEKYGQQFKMSSMRKEIPKDTAGIMRYLDNYFPHIGWATSKRLVDAFGDRLFSVIETKPAELTAISGITETRAQEIHDQFMVIKGDIEQDVFFTTHGITTAMRNRLVEHYGGKAKAIEQIKANPYELAGDVWGVGFKRADTIALSIGIPKESRRRISAGIEWVLEDSAQGGGHCCLPSEKLVEKASEALESGQEKVQEIIEIKLQSQQLSLEDGLVYLPSILDAEREIATRVSVMALTKPRHEFVDLPPGEIGTMDDDQRQALTFIRQSNIVIVTGGPGVGKTYTINKVLDSIDRNVTTALAAPTGKAAKRMMEATGRGAVTIHRLLGFLPGGGGGGKGLTGAFRYCRQNPLPYNVVVIDEASMIDVYLMRSLVEAINPNHTQLILVGDVDQLPSVGPGRVFADLINSEVIPVIRLRTVHRQSEDSYIHINAQRINRGESIELQKASDFFFLEVNDKGDIARVIADALERFSEHYGMGFHDIQTLCPQKKGAVGTVDLNNFLRPIMNPGREKIARDSTFCFNDRVIQIRNNYTLEVFNGEMGLIDEYVERESGSVSNKVDKFVIVRFEDPGGDRLVEYPFVDAESELRLAYALTIHKSQGSEFKAVFIPVHETNWIMLKRNLLYTGITRAKKYVVLVGTLKALNHAIKTVDSATRHTMLRERIFRETRLEV